MSVKSGYKRTEVGVIPDEWEPATIGEVATFSGGAQPPRSTFKFVPTPGYVRLIQIRDYKTDDYASFIPETMARKRCTEDDIMIGRYGPPVFQILRGIEGAYNVALIKATPSHRVEREFFFYVLCQDKLFKRIDSLSRRTSGQTGIEMPALKAYGLALPPVPEQGVIARALNDVDALIGALEKLIVKKRNLKQAAMQQLLTGQTRLPGFQGDWAVKTLGELINNCFSGATPRRDQPDFYKGDIRWITSGELNYNVINDTVEKITSEAVARTNLKVIPKGTFLMAITGLEAAGTRGSCGIVGAPSTTNQSCMAIFPTRELMTEYLFHYYVFRGDALALQYCQGTKQQSYTAKLVRKLPIDIPPTTAEQTAIAKVLSNMDAELAAVEQRLAKTRALKQGMMQELLTGRTRLL